MRPKNFSKDSSEIGAIWYLIPLGWVAVAAVAFALIAHWPALFAGTSEHESAAALSVAPYASDDLSVPAASSVFTAPSYPATEHVQAF
jgi:hypothetical protein